jgi:NAD(P) transhydrogenase subunit alpha
MTTIGVAKEWDQTERRVALDPDTIGRVSNLGVTVSVATQAGAGADFPDSVYREAGAEIWTENELYERSDIVVTVGPPRSARLRHLRSGQILLGMLDPWRHGDLVQICAAREATAISLDLLPRTLSRAQPMDALTSQAFIAGYKAAVLAADTFGRVFPMLTTAAGTTRPASVRWSPATTSGRRRATRSTPSAPGSSI